MTRTTPATSVAAAISLASNEASSGVVFIFQLPAMIGVRPRLTRPTASTGMTITDSPSLPDYSLSAATPGNV